MSEDLKDFRRRVLKVNEPRVHKITNSLGVREAFHWSRKNKLYDTKSVSECGYYKIVRTVNKLMAEELLNSRDVQLPQKMGMLEVRKYPLYVKFIDGEIKTNRKIDWKATLELWNNDEESRESKVLVRCEDSERFVVFYNRNAANYPNKTLMRFRPHRNLIIEINRRGKEGLIDAFTLAKYD
jgi:hypothetical protein